MSNQPPIGVPQGAIRLNTDSQKLEFYAQDRWYEMATDVPTVDGGERAVCAGGSAPALVDTIDFASIASGGNFADFGDLTFNSGQPARNTCASRTRGIIAGSTNAIDFIMIATTGSAQDFGDMTYSASQAQGCSNQTRGIFGGGYSPQPSIVNTINFITIAAEGDALDFGDLIDDTRGAASYASPTRGVIHAGRFSNPVGNTNVIQFMQIATTGNTQDFGDAIIARDFVSGASNATRGVAAGGRIPDSSTLMDFTTIATTGNATGFGDLREENDEGSGCSSSTRMLVTGGTNASSSTINTVQYLSIITGGGSVDFGDLTQGRQHHTALSNAHGGL